MDGWNITALDTAEKIALATLVVAILGLLGLRMQRESNKLAKKTFEVENVPEIGVELRTVPYSPGSMTLREGANYVHRPPDAFVKPIPIVIAVVKNQRSKLLVTISEAGLVNRRTNAFIPFPRRDVDETLRFPSLPYELAGGRSLPIPVTPEVVKDMLVGRHAWFAGSEPGW